MIRAVFNHFCPELDDFMVKNLFSISILDKDMKCNRRTMISLIILKVWRQGQLDSQKAWRDRLDLRRDIQPWQKMDLSINLFP